jgi:prepilin-type processing-associated H-X9-DG protein
MTKESHFAVWEKGLGRARRTCAAFTLLELGVVLALVGLGVLLLLPARAGVKTNSQTLQCLNNLRQLEAAAAMYAGDSEGYMPTNGAYPGTNWAPGRQDWIGVQSTNARLVLSGPLGSYAKTASIYKCPADKEVSLLGPRVRSYSMNGFVGGEGEGNVLWGPAYRVFYTTSDLAARGAADTFIFIDEHPDSINDGLFLVGMPSAGAWPGPANLGDLPASYHADAGGISFADGHVEAHRWVDASMRVPVTKSTHGSISAPNDTRWLSAKASAPK